MGQEVLVDGTTVLGAVLAAGAGRRYGGPKILAHQGEWLDTAAGALVSGGCDEVLVTMGAAFTDPPLRTTSLAIPDWESGLSASVRAVLDRALDTPGCAGVVLHVVDTPDVGGDVVRRVLSVSGRSSSALVRAVYDGTPGHPVYLGHELLADIVGTLSGDKGAGAYLATHQDVVVNVECGDLATGQDIDTPD